MVTQCQHAAALHSLGLELWSCIKQSYLQFLASAAHAYIHCCYETFQFPPVDCVSELQAAALVHSVVGVQRLRAVGTLQRSKGSNRSTNHTRCT